MCIHIYIYIYIYTRIHIDQAQIYAKNPDVKCVNFRGNVRTSIARPIRAGKSSRGKTPQVEKFGSLPLSRELHPSEMIIRLGQDVCPSNERWICSFGPPDYQRQPSWMSLRGTNVLNQYLSMTGRVGPPKVSECLPRDSGARGGEGSATAEARDRREKEGTARAEDCEAGGRKKEDCLWRRLAARRSTQIALPGRQGRQAVREDQCRLPRGER